jgi:lipoprotein-anchoring transpeptidase ErfK/SrfK
VTTPAEPVAAEPVPAEPERSRRTLLALLAAIAATMVVAAGGAIWLSSGDHRAANAATAAEPVPDPVLTASVPNGPRAAAPWNAPLTLTVTDGTLKDVTVLDPDGRAMDGVRNSDASWQSADPTLLPDATYRVTAAVLDKKGSARPMTLAVHTEAAARVLHAVLSPGDDDVVGVGMPIAVMLDHPVKNDADRTALVARLSVTTDPAVQGAWHWMDNSELHYRGAAFWKPGTTISVSANLRRLKLSDGTWGSGTRRTTFRVGDAMVSTVDVTRHVMEIRRNGALLRVVKVSTGRDKYPTKGGVHIVLEKTLLKVMDSETVGIPRNSPDGYYEKVPFSVRISNGGAFVHAASWSVRDQGVRNVSHGCVNLAPADAEWFYGLAKRGDVVNVIHAGVEPVLWDAGMADWNIPFAQWASA